MENIYTGYENVMEFYIQNIFQSGMLLNEHDELLNQFWRTVDLKTSKRRKMYLISAGLVVGSIISICKKSVTPGVIAAIPLGIETYHVLLKKYNIRFYKKTFLSLITVLQSTFSLIKNIKHHYHIRRITIKNLSDDTKMLIEDVILSRMLKLLSDTGELLFNLILLLKTSLGQIGNLIDIGDLNFVFNISLDSRNFIINNDCEESVLDVYDKVQMAYIYVVSTFLCGLGLSFSVKEWKSNNKEFMKIFSTIIPECLQYTKSNYESIKNNFDFMFNTLQEHSSSSKMDKIKQKDVNKHLLNTMNILRQRIQISYNIIAATEYHLMSYTDETLLKAYLEDLENIFNQCKDTLKTLQYVIYKIPSVNTQESSKSIDGEKYSDEIDVIVINHEEFDSNIQDEEYNLSVHGSDFSDDSETLNLEHEQLLDYIRAQKLMIKELNDELRKRNIIKQTDITLVPVKRNHSNNENLRGTAPTLVPFVPPRLITDNTCQTTSHTCDQITNNVSNVDNFLAQIRAAATSRGVEETIFGDEIISSDESNKD